MSRLAAAALAVVLTLGGMYAAMRLAAPLKRSYNLGTLSYQVRPAVNGGVQIVVPVTGWRLEGKHSSAPYVLRVQVRSISLAGLAQAALGFQSTLTTAQNDIVNGATWAFVRALLYALGGGLVGAAVAAIVLLIFRGFGAAILAGLAGVVLAVAVAGGSGIWIWRSDYPTILEHPTVVAGKRSRALTLFAREVAHARSLKDVIRDLAPLLAKELR